MKYSTFLFSFLFPLAISVNIEITIQDGVHIYEIFENWNENPKYVKKINIDTRDTFILDTRNSYVILQIRRNSSVLYLYYWTGAQSSEKKRINAAHSFAFIYKNEIPMKMTACKIKAFRREPEGAESVLFRAMFKLPYPADNNMGMRLYRIAGSRGQFVTEVPLMYNELNDSDSFVLEKYTKVLIWNSSHSNEYKKHQAGVLSQRILNHDKKLGYDGTNLIWVTEGDRNISPDFYDFFINEFLMVLEGMPESRQFPQKEAKYSDIDIQNNIREKFKLLRYTWFWNHVKETIVKEEILTMDTFSTHNTYVLVDFHNGNIFAFLGHLARTEQIKIALSTAEKFSKTTGVPDSWKRVKIIKQKHFAPSYFIIYLFDGLRQ